jgi:hypothetical protein
VKQGDNGGGIVEMEFWNGKGESDVHIGCYFSGINGKWALQRMRRSSTGGQVDGPEMFKT